MFSSSFTKNQVWFKESYNKVRVIKKECNLRILTYFTKGFTFITD